MVANPRILKQKTKTQYTRLQPNLKKPEQQIHQVKQNQNRAHQRQQPTDGASGRATMGPSGEPHQQQQIHLAFHPLPQVRKNHIPMYLKQ